MMHMYGWKKIASEAHSFQLLRRAIKDYRKLVSRYDSAQKPVPAWFADHRYEIIGKIKPGNWYRYRPMSPLYRVVEVVA